MALRRRTTVSKLDQIDGAARSPPYMVLTNDPSTDMLWLLVFVRLAPDGLKGKPVKIRHCPAAVSGNETGQRTGSPYLGSDGK
jgi:hypothetical protein